MNAQAQATTSSDDRAESDRADACLAALDAAGQVIARRVFLRLIDFGEDRAATRRAEPLSALGAGNDPERLADVLRHLTEARLLQIDGNGAYDDASDGASDGASGEARVELANDDLIASWPTLQGWIRTHGKTEQLRRQLETEAAQWRRRTDQGLLDVGLLDKSRLAELTGALTPAARRDLGVSDVAESFLAASQAATRLRWWPKRTTIGAGLAVLAILMIMATPVTLLSLVGLTAALIHRLFG